MSRVLEVHLKDLKTGAEKVFYEKIPHDFELHTLQFVWSEGDYACDCQRGEFLYGRSPYTCKDMNIVIKKAVVRPDGFVLIEDEEPYACQTSTSALPQLLENRTSIQTGMRGSGR